MSKRINGEGSWGKRIINGYNYVTYRTPDGKTIYGKTQKEVKEKLASQKQRLTISPKIKFGDYILDWLLFKQSELEPTTYECYETMINSMIINFREYNLATKQIGSLNPRIFQAYLNSLATQYSRASITKIWALIKQCVKYGELQNELMPNSTAMVKVPLESKVAVKKKEIPFLTMNQAEDFYNLLKVSRFRISTNAHALVLILFTGMRVGEMIALKWKNVDLDNKRIHIVESSAIVGGETIDKAPKTPTSIRWIPLPDKAIEMLEYFKEREYSKTYVCATKNGTRLNRRNVNRTLASMCSEMNIDKLNVHALRHSYGSILLSQGVDIKIISELLGHANISITYDIYIGIKEEDKQDAIENVFN